jgi:MEMO1 family protein
VDHPRLRAVEPFPAEGDRFYVRDPLRISDAVLLVPRAALYAMSLLDGTRSATEVRAEFARATGEVLSREGLDEILGVLDQALFLDNERFARAQAEVVRSFHASDSRGAINAGLSYPGESAELATYLGALFSSLPAATEDGPRGGPLEAMVAPHIDMGRGGAAYAAIYRELARHSSATRFVVLGICHHPTLHPFALTRKDYETPFGAVATDRDLVDRLAAACGTDFLADEIAHRDEHSIEFQMLFLSYLFGGHSALCPARDVSVVPILCSSFHEQVGSGESPARAAEISEFLGALRGLLGDRKTDCLVAAVDFAHLGRQFGQELEVTDGFLGEAEADDRRMIERITARDAEGFFRLIAEEKDRRNVCGVPAIYSLLHLLGVEGPAGRVLRYGQAADRTNHSVVTFAGIAFPAVT